MSTSLIYVWLNKYVQRVWIRKMNVKNVVYENMFSRVKAHCISSVRAWLLSEDNYEPTVLCHNLQGYDTFPILHYLY